MRIHVTITSYNRPESLNALLAQLEAQGIESVTIHDDRSDLEKAKQMRPGKFLLLHHRHAGKPGMPGRWMEILRGLPKADLYLFLPDDVLFSAQNPHITPKGVMELAVGQWKALPAGAESLNLLCDHRFGIRNWTNTYGEWATPDCIRSGWWDLCGFLSPAAVQEIVRKGISGPAPGMASSGVGASISRTLDINRQYMTRHKLLEHLDGPSMMHPQLRDHEPLRTWTVPKIVAGMATIPGRERQCEGALHSVVGQADDVFVVMNGGKDYRAFENIDPFRVHCILSDNSLGDGEKFRGILDDGDFYYFSLDDDLIYPPGYVWEMIHRIEHYKRTAVIGIHGKIMRPRPLKRFYGGHSQMFHTSQALAKDQVVDVIGSGCAAWHSSTLKFSIEDVKAPNMADIWLSKAAHEQGVRLICMARPANYLKIQKVADTIYDRFAKGGDELQTEVWNSIQPVGVVKA